MDEQSEEHTMTLRTLLQPLIAALLIVAASVPVQGETIIRKSVTYFSIGGTTVSDLDREMLRRGPLSRTTGRRHPGATQIRFNGSAKFVDQGGRCVIGGAKVSLSTKLILPRWTNRKRANRQMALIWDTLSADIKRHEERHAEIARTHARNLERTILRLSAARDCPTLKARVNRVSQDAMVAHDKDQQRFDRIESANFENRMIRLLRYRISTQAAK
jgi:predicted secreted Zn-dependent protease